MARYFAQTSGTLQTNATSPTAIAGLTFVLPEGANDLAFVTLNLPNPYATGNNFPGGWFGISVDGTVLPAYATFTYGVGQPASFNRMPTTLVVSVPLGLKPQTIQAMWQGIRGSTVIMDSPASLSAVI
jgi:mannose-binding lectin